MKNIQETKTKKIFVGLLALVLLVIFGLSLASVVASSTVEDRYTNLELSLKAKALEFCKLHQDLLAEQVKGGLELELDVEDLSAMKDNLEVESNCFLHTAAILEGKKELGKSKTEEKTE